MTAISFHFNFIPTPNFNIIMTASSSSDPISAIPATKLADDNTVDSSVGGIEDSTVSPIGVIPSNDPNNNDQDDSSEDIDVKDDHDSQMKTPAAACTANKKRGPFSVKAIWGGRGKPSVPTMAIAFPHVAQVATKFALGAIVTLYILNQQHMLPRGLSSIVSKTLFWPTLPITVSRRLGKWTTQVDDTVIMGGAPIGWLNVPKKLHEEYGVTSVINLCEEYKGPTKQYQKLGIKELRLPTTDHFEPSVEDMKTAVDFIQQHHKSEGMGKVYVHCRAGHGRSAAVVFAWLMSKADDIDSLDLEKLNAELCKLRDVRKALYKQPNVNEFRSWLRLKGKPKQEDPDLAVEDHHDVTVESEMKD